MPTWGEILAELGQPANRLPNGTPNFDAVRRKYLAELHALTGRPTIIYYTDWFGKGGPAASITLEDMQGMMEVCKDLPGPDMDILLHSPGGSAEAAAAIVRYLRTKYSNIRVFVPIAAMSAATMWTFACNLIVMGKHSQLGPIDPQMVSPAWQAPARAILKQFEQAREECKDPALLGAWMPILQQYGPALIQQCEAAEALAKRLAREWLETYMFAGAADAAEKAGRIASYFANYEIHQSHSLGITREQAKDQGLLVGDLETDQKLQDAVLSVHHATMHTFNGPAIKIVENHLGRTYARLAAQQVVLQVPMPGQPGGMPAGVPGVGIPGGIRLPGSLRPESSVDRGQEAAQRGERFDEATGLPDFMLRKDRDITWYEHTQEYAAARWKGSAGNSRLSIVESLTCVTHVLVRDLRGAPDPDTLRAALRKDFNHGRPATLVPDETKAIAWLKRASLPVSALNDDSVVTDVLDALAARLDGTPAAPDYYARRLRVARTCLSYAIRKKRLTRNPLLAANLPEHWTPPNADDAVDPRSVGARGSWQKC